MGTAIAVRTDAVGGADEGRCAGAVAIGIAAVLDGNSRTEGRTSRFRLRVADTSR